MKQVSEQGYGARLLAYKDLVRVMQKLNLVSIRPEESVAEMTALCTQAETALTVITSAMQVYNSSNQNRATLFKTDANSVIKTLPVIRKYIDALYGKTSNEAKQVATAIDRLRSKPATIVSATADAAERSISNSELSYGSMTQNYSSLITYIIGFQNYNPAIPSITISALQTKLDQINSINETVTNSLTDLRLARGQRNAIFPDLHERALRIKALIIATYGLSSEEYKSIKSLKL